MAVSIRSYFKLLFALIMFIACLMTIIKNQSFADFCHSGIKGPKENDK